MRALRNLGRWVCVLHPRDCDGLRVVRGDIVDCPLADKCLDFDKKFTYYEYPLTRLTGGTYRELVDEHPNHAAEHNRRYARLLDAFAPERRKAQAAAYYENHRERLNEHNRKMREKNRKPRAEKPKTTLPCGEDCENCPHDACIYGDADEDALILERKREWKRQYRREHRAEENAYKRRRRIESPEFAERDRERGRRYRAEHREELAAKAKARYAARTEAEKELQRAKDRARYAKDREKRCAYNRARYRNRTPEQHAKQLEYQRRWREKKRRDVTSDE